MKFLKITTFLFILVFITSCVKTETTSSDLHPDFKIGKTGFEKKIKKEFDFKKLSIGTYLKKKNGFLEEKGINLTFETSNQELVGYDKLKLYSEKIKNITTKYLLNIKTYDYVNITFNINHDRTSKDTINNKATISIKKKLK